VARSPGAYYAGQTAIVTGGASGIGRALAIGLSARGADVALFDRDMAGAEAVASAIDAAGGRARPVDVDVTDPAALAAAIDGVLGDFGRLDFMFNNAGIGLVGEVRDMAAEHWQRVIATDLLGVAYGTQLAYQRMLAVGSGHIVNTASLYGLVPSAGLAAYAAAKHGVVALSRVLAAEARGFGVRVSVVCPGYVDTPVHLRTEYVGIDGRRLLASLPDKPVSPERLAGEVLGAVARGEFLIMVPRSVAVAWRIHKLSPWLSDLALSWSLRVLRRARVAQ
jgi:NAD(P)-dependent dehydrogenase (short-subunit alcohol dehydrogenase family)